MTITIEITTDEVLGLLGKTESTTAPETVAEKPKVKAKPKKSAIDIGKMKALRDAGWSMQKIADEMRVSLSTVSKRLNEGD